MNITGMPSSITAGTQVCFTVTGVNGTLSVQGLGGATNVVVQAATRTGTYTVCFTPMPGSSKLWLADGSGFRSVALHAK